jgi:hypothetical protein
MQCGREVQTFWKKQCPHLRKGPPLIPDLSLMNLVHTFPSYMIHFNIILSSKPCIWSFPLRLPDQNLVFISYHLQVWYMPAGLIIPDLMIHIILGKEHKV